MLRQKYSYRKGIETHKKSENRTKKWNLQKQLKGKFPVENVEI